MKYKVIVLIALLGFVFGSCQKKQCPAYGKYQKTLEKEIQKV